MVISLRHDFTVSIQSRAVTRLVRPLAGWVIEEQLPVLSDPPDIMEAIHTLAETLQISNGEAIELIMREEANLPDYA